MFPHIPFIPQSTQNPPKDAVAPPELPQERTPTPSKENAKDAILALVRANITYHDLLAEGIKAPLLNALFTELKIPLPKPPAPAEPVEILDPAMERKDRIAKLLAAKKNPSAAASPKEPVQHVEPVERISTPELVARKETPSPVPVKHRPRQQHGTDFSIPGLFMTSAEQEELEMSIPPTVASIVEVEHSPVIVEEAAPIIEDESVNRPIVAEHYSAPASDPEPEKVESPVRQPTPPSYMENLDSRSLKRGPEPFSADIMPQSKRQVSISQDVAPLSEPDKVIDPVSGVSRSKVNQNILKDRMAALKADLLLKNSRKKALQDGMPVLNAEVQKTRERLQDNETRLRSIRTEIEDKSTELARLREEESQLQDEVQRLKDQLSDGETGQQRFSNELTQLNDQIMADENESKVSQSSKIPATFKSIPIAVAASIDAVNSRLSESTPTHVPGIHAEQESLLQHADTVEEPALPEFPTFSSTRPTETEYSPEQDDLDRQLNNEVAYTVSQRSPAEVDAASHLSMPDPTHALEFVTPTPPTGMESDQDSDDDRMSIDEAEDSESIGSASMSDSGSDEYEPPVPLDMANEPDEDDADDYEPQEDTLVSQESSYEADGDDYEPSEQVSVLNVDALDVPRQQGEVQVHAAAQRFIEDTNMHAPMPAIEAGMISSPPTERQQALASATQVQTLESGTMTSIEPLSNSHGSVPSVPQFVPYSSPLSNTKPFRFNAQFNDIVKEGYRSLTYSHQIDKDVPLCPTELSGIQCTDGDCEEQHFSRFALSGTSSLPSAG